MYTAPHPNTSRTVWIVGTNKGVESKVRFYPLDPRFDHPDNRLLDLTRAFKPVVHEYWSSFYYPGNYNWTPVHKEIKALRAKHRGQWKALDLPVDNLQIRVYENRWAEDLGSLQSEIIHEHGIEE